MIVNQARMLAYLLEHMERSAGRLGRSTACTLATSIDADGSRVPGDGHPAAREGPQETGETSTVRARYVVGCDGARSATRTAIGRELVGDATDESWGVMDVLAVTDFPDIRVKCAINSAITATC